MGRFVGPFNGYRFGFINSTQNMGSGWVEEGFRDLTCDMSTLVTGDRARS